MSSDTAKNVSFGKVFCSASVIAKELLIKVSIESKWLVPTETAFNQRMHSHDTQPKAP